jgi:hypothetical protein
MRDVREMLTSFIQGPDRSIAAANQIECALATQFPDDERFEDLVHDLALYRPGGGDFLLDEQRILPLCRAALAVLT